MSMKKLKTRREFMVFLMAGGIVTAAGFWLPGQKLISIVRQPTLAELQADPLLYARQAWQQSFVDQLLPTQDYLNQLRSTMLFNTIMRPDTLRLQYP